MRASKRRGRPNRYGGIERNAVYRAGAIDRTGGAVTGGYRGAIAMNLKPGTAFLFEQRTWHGVGRNWSGISRKTFFFGYGYRWVKPMDYIAMPEEVIARSNPVQKQLLGVVSDPISYYLPKDEDVPLKALADADG